MAIRTKVKITTWVILGKLVEFGACLGAYHNQSNMEYFESFKLNMVKMVKYLPKRYSENLN